MAGIVDRLAFYRSVIWRPASGVVAAIWLAVQSWDTVQAQLFSESWRNNTPPLLDVVANQPWYLWTVIGLALLIVITLEGAYRQSRSTALGTASVREGALQSPILPSDQLFIDMEDYTFAEPGTEGYPASGEGTRLWLRAGICLNTGHYMNVESLELEVLDRRIPSDWESDNVGGVPYGRYAYFGIPDWVTPGEHSVRLVAFADGKWWRSPDYTVPFPVSS